MTAPEIPIRADDETASPEYAARFAGPVGEWMLQVQTTIIRDLVAPYLKEPPEALPILDVGGGHAQVAHALLDWLPRGAIKLTVVGSTIQSRRRLTAFVESGACSFQHADLLALPYPDKSFDLVTCFRLLPHCDEWEKLIQELCRVARRAVIVDYPTTQSINLLTPFLFKAKKGIEKNTRPYTLFRKSQIRGAFAQVAFKEARERAQFFWPMALHRALQRRQLSERLERWAEALGATARLGSPLIGLFVPLDTSTPM